MAKQRTRTDRLTLADGVLRYEAKGDLMWEFRVSDLVLVAEWTNDGGPFIDDYFYVFFAGTPIGFFEAPMYAGPASLDEVSASLGTALRPMLCWSTDFRSRVVWPPALEDHPFFDFSLGSRPPGFVNHIMDRVLPFTEMRLTPEVAEYLRRKSH